MKGFVLTCLVRPLCSQITHTHTHRSCRLRHWTSLLGFQLVKGPHPGVNGMEPACLCRDRNQSKASWKQLLREDFQICMEGSLSWDWQKLSPFLTIEKVSDALWKTRQLGECPPGDWQWMLEHSCQGLAWMSALGGESWGGVGEATSSDGPSSSCLSRCVDWSELSMSVYTVSSTGAALQRIMPTAPSMLSACGKPGICELREPLWSTQGSPWGCTALAEGRGSWKLQWCGKLWLTWQGFPVYESMICVTPLN